MACEIAITAGGIFVVWGRPTEQDVMRVEEELVRAKRRRGSPVVYVTRVPLAAPTPSESVRKLLKARMPGIMDCCSSYHVILEGTGFVAACKRAVLTGLLQAQLRSKVFFVHANSDGVVPSVSFQNKAAAERLMEHANAMGLLNCDAPVSMNPPSAASA